MTLCGPITNVIADKNGHALFTTTSSGLVKQGSVIDISGTGISAYDDPPHFYAFVQTATTFNLSTTPDVLNPANRVTFAGGLVGGPGTVCVRARTMDWFHHQKKYESNKRRGVTAMLFFLVLFTLAGCGLYAPCPAGRAMLEQAHADRLERIERDGIAHRHAYIPTGALSASPRRQGR